jgi:hypothetical protein
MADSEPDVVMVDARLVLMTSPWLLITRLPRLYSFELSKQRVILRYNSKVFRACPKIVYKRGGIFWI